MGSRHVDILKAFAKQLVNRHTSAIPSSRKHSVPLEFNLVFVLAVLCFPLVLNKPGRGHQPRARKLLGGCAMTSAWSRLSFAMRRISETRRRGRAVPTSAFHILQSYIKADRDNLLERAAAKKYLLTMLFCFQNLVQTDQLKNL